MPALIRHGVDSDELVISKRIRQEASPSSAHAHSRRSRIFAPFRKIGLVSPTHVPFTTRAVGKSSFHLTTSTGRSLQTYDLRSGLNLVFVTQPQTPGPITAVTSWGERVLAAWSAPGHASSSPAVWIFNRGRKIAELVPPAADSNEDIVDLVVFGSWIVCCCVTLIHVWKSDTLEYYATFTSPLAGSDDACLTGGIATMPTFANKIFAGRADGSVEIWNVSTGRILHRILPHADGPAAAVSALEPAPALSLMAIAYSNGLVTIHDVVVDRTLMSINARSPSHAAVTSISFRTDEAGAGVDGRQAGVMATASEGSGDVDLWDLNDGGRRMSTLRSAHSTVDGAVGRGISRVEFLSGQAILVTSGADNALRTWTFDDESHSSVPRLLHSRYGHAAPVTTLTFLPTDAAGADFTGKWLMSSGKDSALWSWSLRKDGQSTELSQGPVRKRARRGDSGNVDARKRQGQSRQASEITCLACSLNRDGGSGAAARSKVVWSTPDRLKGRSTATDPNLTGWESIVTGHAGETHARTWFWGRRRAGRWLLETGDRGLVRSVAVSPCGTFALIGSSLGAIDMFNLQSGQHRQRFPPKLSSNQAKDLSRRMETSHHVRSGDGPLPRGTGKHQGSVTGIDVDGLNKTVLSCGEDGRFKFWDFHSGQLLSQINLSHSGKIDGLRLHRASNLCAIACSDGSLRIIDIDARRIVREFVTQKVRHRDWCFSNDGRWVVSCSSDSIIRVWDLPTGHLIDAMQLARPCTAIAFSHTGEFLATAQEDGFGIDIWTNRSLFSHVSVLPLSESSIAKVEGPGISGGDEQEALEPVADLADEEDASDGALVPTLDQLSREVETLSLVPRANWQSLLHLDLIRDRNRPVEPPKAPERAPFFLTSLASGPDGRMDGEPEAAAPDALQRASRILRSDASSAPSRFSSLLRQAASNASDTDALPAFVAYLRALPPAQADTQIRSLDAQSTENELASFVRVLTMRLQQRKDYELLQTWMSVFMRCHGSLIADMAEGEEHGRDLVEALSRWRRTQRQEANRLDHLAGYCTGVLSYLRSSR